MEAVYEPETLALLIVIDMKLIKLVCVLKMEAVYDSETSLLLIVTDMRPT
jgi:hypothetical protein